MPHTAGMRTVAEGLVRGHLEEVNSWAGQSVRGSLPAAVAKLRLTASPLRSHVPHIKTGMASLSVLRVGTMCSRKGQRERRN